VDTFLREARARHPASPVERLSREALARMLDHSWPGNVRELQHAVERLVLLGRAAEAQVADLPPALREGNEPRSPEFRGEVLPMREMQRRYAAWALERMGGQRGRTAEALGIDAKTLARWLRDDGDQG
jgi:two-component system response regulator HydG